MNKKLLAAILAGAMLIQLSSGFVYAEETTGEAAEEEQIEADNTRFGTGVVDGERYDQEFFGFKLELDEDWVFADEEIKNALGNTLTELATDEVREAIDSGSSYLDMYAEKDTSYQNINATITKVSMTEALMFISNPSDMVSQMLEPAKDQLEQMGLSNMEIRQDEIEFLGEKVPCARLLSYPEGLDGEVALYQTQVYLVQGSYMCTLTASSYLEDTTEEVLAKCSRL